MGFPVLCASRVNILISRSSSSSRSASLRKHADRWAPVKLPQGPLNAFSAAATAASTSASSAMGILLETTESSDGLYSVYVCLAFASTYSPLMYNFVSSDADGIEYVVEAIFSSWGSSLNLKLKKW